MRRLLRDSLTRDLPAQLQAEAQAFLACAKTPDFSEGVAAFLAKSRAICGLNIGLMPTPKENP